MLFSMAVTYIAVIRGKNNHLIEENLKLLDKMHEGLIVVTEDEHHIKFANSPARRLLKQLPIKSEKISQSTTAKSKNQYENILQDHGEYLVRENLDKKMFKLTKINADREGDGKSDFKAKQDETIS